MRRINILKVVFEGKDKIESCHCVCKFTGNYVSVGGFNLHLLLTLNGCIANQLNQVFVNYSKFCITTELTVYAIAKWHCLNAPSVEILKNRSLPFRFELKNRLQNNSKIRRFLSKVDCCTSLQCRLPKWVVQRRQRVLNSAARLLRQLHKFNHTTQSYYVRTPPVPNPATHCFRNFSLFFQNPSMDTLLLVDINNILILPVF